MKKKRKKTAFHFDATYEKDFGDGGYGWVNRVGVYITPDLVLHTPKYNFNEVVRILNLFNYEVIPAEESDHTSELEMNPTELVRKLIEREAFREIAKGV